MRPQPGWAWVLPSGNIELIPLLFYGLLYAALIGWLWLIISYLMAPPIVKLLMRAKLPGFHKILLLSFDKSRLVKVMAGEPLGYGIYKLAKDKVKMLPRTPYIGPLPYTLDLPIEATGVGAALANQESDNPGHDLEPPGPESDSTHPEAKPPSLPGGTLTETIWLDQEDILPHEAHVQEMLDRVHFLEGLKVPTYITFEGYGLALNADTVASLQPDNTDNVLLVEPSDLEPEGRLERFSRPKPQPKKRHPIFRVSFAQALLPAKLIPGAIARRITDSQLAYVAKLYYNMGRKEAEGAGGKIFIVMFILMILMALLFLWQGGYFA